jgi:hypothetical protein
MRRRSKSTDTPGDGKPEKTPRARRAPRVSKSATESASRIAAIADAWTAAEMARRLAHAAANWAALSGVGDDDAAEVFRAAMRAKDAAEQAERAATLDEAWQAARLAWAAVSSAHEADGRVSAAIAEALAEAA